MARPNTTLEKKKKKGPKAPKKKEATNKRKKSSPPPDVFADDVESGSDGEPKKGKKAVDATQQRKTKAHLVASADAAVKAAARIPPRVEGEADNDESESSSDDDGAEAPPQKCPRVSAIQPSSRVWANAMASLDASVK